MDSPRRPVPLSARTRPRRKSGKKKSPRLQPRIKSGDESSGFWLSFALATLLMCSLAAWYYFPRPLVAVRQKKTIAPLIQMPIQPPPTAPVAQAPPPSLSARELLLARLQAEVKQERSQEVVRALPQPSFQLKTEPPSLLPPPALPPLAVRPAVPAPVTTPPVPDNLTPQQIAAYQTILERRHFSCGFIDGESGMRTQRMLRAFQQSQGLPVTGQFDAATREAIGDPTEPLQTYIVTSEDLAAVMPKPSGWREKSQVASLGYNDMWELLAEKFHCTRDYLKALNRKIDSFDVGTAVTGPEVTTGNALPHAASLKICLSDTSIEALDAAGQIVAFFPCSIAADKNKRPNGELKVISVVPDPDYTFDPNLFKEAAEREGIHEKLTLPPGPRNPVGTAWIGLSLPGYGIHGTPEPENISRTQSHGCFRLANWNAEKLLQMVTIGTPVEVEP